ncbi:hypothetical protein PR048_030415 [Dryococelus australis]|uniref:MADF domain-containing protein n=1 Tax=Dryococelus australis TaxID=614101 RepID=A0ABQ9GCS8_9NEOP|nr:hypothetical protein PR048_030415 [Dryococelus australis]
MSAPRSLKLSDNETMRFIELYENETLIYDVTMVEYRNRDLRAAAAAKRIADALNASGFGPGEVITNFKNLRNSFLQEEKKKKSQIGANQVAVQMKCIHQKFVGLQRCGLLFSRDLRTQTW